MADRFCSSTGSNTSPYDTWAKAATDFATVITGSSSGDRLIVDVTNPPADIGANTTWTFVANCSVIASTNSGTSTVTPTAMGTSAWLGNSTTSYSVTLAGAFQVYIYGLTFRTAGASNVAPGINSSNGGHFELEDCLFWSGTTNGSARVFIGAGSSNVRSYTRLKNCTYRFGATAQGITLAGAVDIDGGSISGAGSTPTTLFGSSNSQDGDYHINGFDASNCTGPLVASHTSCATTYRFEQCKIPSGVTVLATQSVTNKSSAKVWLLDCASGDTHGLFGYYDAFGSVVSDTGIYFTAGAAGQSWKIVTSAACSYNTPFVTPWIRPYNTGTSAITPYLEILRDGSTTAYQDDEVWAEFMAKITSGTTLASLSTDRMAVAGTPANQAAGAGLGSWTGESGTAWSGKIDSGSSITPAEVGHIRARVAVGEPSITVYVDPQIRT